MKQEKQQIQRLRIELQQYKLCLINDGKLSEECQALSTLMHQGLMSVNLHLVPKFNEHDPDTLFALFEHVADSRNWLDSEHTQLLNLEERL